ncbi:class I SAM-dependent methyltransferase [Candidatus Thorarchaeota archaeon]|nr:MAG: class I SAM-dependent methyltransferase [Candidatus Thorarchaeota archaeon]
MDKLSAFDLFAKSYDRSIDWNARLEHEMPFILDSIKSEKACRVLDIACGTGRHAIALSAEGMNVIGLDNSKQMIAQARKYSKEYGHPVKFIHDDMTNLASIFDEEFDLIICLGNSLSLLPSLETVERVLIDAARLISDEGSLVFQVLNFEAIRRARDRFFPLKGGKLDDGKEVIFARFFEHLKETATTTLVLTALIEASESWKPMVSRRQLIQMDMPTTMSLLESAGLGVVEIYQDYDKSDFNPITSRNIVVRARKTPTKK